MHQTAKDTTSLKNDTACFLVNSFVLIDKGDAMKKKETKKTWVQILQKVCGLKTSNLREIAVYFGGNPSNFYIGVSMSGLDLRGQDLRSMALPMLKRAKGVWVDEKTILDVCYQDLYEKFLFETKACPKLPPKPRATRYLPKKGRRPKAS